VASGERTPRSAWERGTIGIFTGVNKATGSSGVNFF
jgi:hypothetical protein